MSPAKLKAKTPRRTRPLPPSLPLRLPSPLALSFLALLGAALGMELLAVTTRGSSFSAFQPQLRCLRWPACDKDLLAQDAGPDQSALWAASSGPISAPTAMGGPQGNALSGEQTMGCVVGGRDPMSAFTAINRGCLARDEKVPESL